MSGSEQPISRRHIPDNLGGTETIFDNAPIVGAVEMSDGVIAFVPSLFVLFLFQSLLPSSLQFVSWIFFGFTLLGGVVLLLMKPSYKTLSTWIGDVRRFRNAPDHYRKALPSGKGGDETEPSIDSIQLNSNEDTRQQILINRLYPQFGAVERVDDTLVGMFRIRGLNLDSASQGEKQQYIARLDNFVNQNLEDDVQLYLPMRQFDASNQIQGFEERIENSRVLQNDPLLQEYISDRISFVSAMSIGTYIREYYLVCKVDKKEVISKEAEAGQTNDIVKSIFNPIGLGEVASAIYLAIKGTASTVTSEELKQLQLERLVEKRQDISNRFEGVVGCRTEQVNADEVGILLKEFWEGESISGSQKDGFIRKNPYVKGKRDKQKIAESDEVQFTQTQDTTDNGGE